MRIVLTICVCVCAAQSVAAQTPGGWRGLTPLRSTRADVERVLGAPGGSCKCVYRTREEVVFVDYATGRCEGRSPGWNVPADTVLRFNVRPQVWRKFAELNLDENRLAKHYDDSLTAYYLDRDKGVEYEVSQDRMVTAVSYVPSTQDARLRCRGFVAEEWAVTTLPRFGLYTTTSFRNAISHLDSFALSLQNEPTMVGYIVAFAGGRTSRGEAMARANRARDYLVKKRGIDEGRVVAVYGGRRAAWVVELFILPKGRRP